MQAGEDGESSDEAAGGVGVLAAERADGGQRAEIPDRDLALPTVVVTPLGIARKAARSESLEYGGRGEASRPDIYGVSGVRAHWTIPRSPAAVRVGPDDRHFKTTLIYADYAPAAHETEMAERAFGRKSQGAGASKTPV